MRDADDPQHPCTLTRAELDQCDPRKAGGRIRARCPFHGSDHQRSLSVDPDTGYWRCFGCQRWGRITDWAGADQSTVGAVPHPVPAPTKAPPRPLPAGLCTQIRRWRQALCDAGEDHPAVAYLRTRGIPVAVAVANGWGTCPGADWPGRREAPELQPWREAGMWALVAPTWGPSGDGHWQPVNVYARIAGGVEPRHDFMRGPKGLLLARPAEQVHPEVVLVEGPMDALALAVAGYRAVALLGASSAGVPWDSLPDAPLVIATDCDAAGRGAAARLLVAALRAGRDARILSSAWYAGAKDAAELLALQGGTLPALHYAEPPAPPLPAPSPPAPRPASTAVAPPSRGAPGDALAGQVALWVEKRCVRTPAYSASLDGLLADFRAWGGAVDRAVFAAALGGLGVRVVGGVVVVGLVLH